MTDLAEARGIANRLRNSLPSSITAADLGVRSKAPYLLLCAREALIWRTEELARNACDALERDDFAVAAILTRAVTESAAFVWKLMEVLEARQQHSPQQLHELLMRLLLGSKRWPEFPRAFQIMDCIDRIDKRVPGVRRDYDGLSEIAHPNWHGVAGLYSENDEAQLMTRFGRGLMGAESSRGQILNAMIGSLGLFEHAYNRITEIMSVFLAELESLQPDEAGQSPSGEGPDVTPT
jgi:hypothetical protein